jgi:sugar O-acyltransferase (sialic acid O-acetyltransferase NeuD family)
VTRELILLVGAGGHAKVCIDVIEQEGLFSIGGLVGLPSEVGSQVLNYPVLGTDADLPALLCDFAYALVTLGQIKIPEPRMRSFDLLLRRGCSLPTIVSPHAFVSPHATLGAGTIVMHGAVVNAAATVGQNCIINSSSLIEHDAIIADHCHISTAAVINGGASIGTGTFIGSNSVVRQGISIGTRCVVGMGQRVFADCADGMCLPSEKPS